MEYPRLLHTAIDTTDVRGLAEFYRQLLGLRYRDGDDPPAEGVADDADWLVLVDANGARKLAFQQVERLERTTWPEHDVPMQMHLDFEVSDLAAATDHALELGATLAGFQPQEDVRVLMDPAGHPFCLYT